MTVTSASPMSNTSEDTQLLDTIERWTMRELKPIVREYDHEDRYPATVVEQMKELGLFGATVSEEYGRSRAKFRWLHVAALARVVASAGGQPAPGVAEARKLLGL